MLSVSSNKSSSASAAASIIGNNSDILIDILYCLPVKSLCVFRTVSKQWQSLISDPYFKRNYNLRSCRLSIPALFMKKVLMDAFLTESEFKTLVMDERNGIDCINIPIDVTFRSRIKFEHSCNGLVLYEVYDGSNYHTTYVVHNPSLKHCRTLPKPPIRKTRIPYVLGLTIAFNPAKSSYYEVLAVCDTDTSESSCRIEIYSSKTDSWRDAGDPFPFSAPGRLSVSGVYWNGSVHWIDQWTASLHYFDIDCELMKKIAMPTQPYPVGDYGRQIEYFKECMGHIHLMEMRYNDMPRVDIWEMRMDYTGWNVKYCVDLSPLTTVYPGIIRDRVYLFRQFDLYVLLIEEGKDSSRLILWIAEEGKVISFDLKNMSFKEMYDVNPDVRVEGFQYIETLVHA